VRDCEAPAKQEKIEGEKIGYKKIANSILIDQNAVIENLVTIFPIYHSRREKFGQI